MNGDMKMGVSSVSKSEEVYDLIKKSMDAASLRSKVISNNIANINTKDYKRSYVNFEDTLKKNTDDLELKTSEDKHIKNTEPQGEISIQKDNTTSMNEDGNNVDLENEEVNMVSNALMYNALITVANNKLSVTKYIINGRG